MEKLFDTIESVPLQRQVRGPFSAGDLYQMLNLSICNFCYIASYTVVLNTIFLSLLGKKKKFKSFQSCFHCSTQMDNFSHFSTV